jgi:hypothetical protein
MKDKGQVHREFERLLEEKEAPMGGWIVVPMIKALEVHLGPLRPHAAIGLERRVGAILAELGFRGNDGRLPVLSSGKKLDVASHFSYILKRLYLSLLRVGMFKEATTAPFCK